MAKNKRVSDIDIDEDIGYQEREWQLQPIGWALIWLSIIAALLGVFGKGVLANAEASDPTGALTVTYARLERYRSPTTIEAIIGPEQAKEGKLTLALDREFVSGVELTGIEPEPDAVKSDSDRMLYEFAVADPSQPAHVFINYEYETIGPVGARLGLEGGPQVELNTFVFP